MQLTWGAGVALLSTETVQCGAEACFLRLLQSSETASCLYSSGSLVYRIPSADSRISAKTLLGHAGYSGISRQLASPGEERKQAAEHHTDVWQLLKQPSA